MDGSGATTVTQIYSNYGSASQQLLSATYSSISANGLSKLNKYDRNGDGIYEVSDLHTTSVDANAIWTHQYTTSANNGAVLSVRTELRDEVGKRIAVADNRDNVGWVDFTENATIAGDGSRQVVSRNYGNNGVVLNQTIQTTSADGRSASSARRTMRICMRMARIITTHRMAMLR